MFIDLTTMAIHHCVSVSKTGYFRVPPEFGPGCGANCNSHARNIDPPVHKVCSEIFCCVDGDFGSSSPKVQSKMIYNTHSLNGQSIYSSGTDPAMAHPHHDQGSIDKDFHE